MARMLKWNTWKMATIGIAVVITTALITGLVVANWNGQEAPKPAAAVDGQPGQRVAAPTSTQSSRSAKRDKTGDVLEKAVIGGAIGAGVGAAGGAIAGGGKGAGKGAAIGGLVGATAGTLYGLEKNK